MKINNSLIMAITLFISSSFLLGNSFAAESTGGTSVHDEASYTKYVETTMKKLDKLYLDFCNTCNVSASKAEAARQEYYTTVRDLMQHMNGRFDELDPKKGAALSHTEVLVSIHVLTMLVDMLTATQMANMADPNP